MIKVDKTKCTGCGSCVQRCPKKCISWVDGDFGFRYPEIDLERCVSCGLCEQVCPIGKTLKKPDGQRAYAAVHKDTEILEKSASGGMFAALAEPVLARGGVVYGAAMDQSFRVKHIRVDNVAELEKLHGSKYVQSSVEDTYCTAEMDLKCGKEVLFSGTPCQIAGLYGFLGKQYENLITADIVCHGVGSQKYFDRFIEYLESREGRILKLNFRSKKFSGWSVSGDTESMVKERCVSKPFYDYNNYYYYYFLRGDIYRDSCYSCPYASTDRPGDFTLGDFWGVEALRLPVNTEQGCSLVLINTPKAERLFSEIGSVESVETTMTQAASQNSQLRHPTKRSVRRPVLIQEYETMTGKEMDGSFRKNHRKQIILLHLKAWIPYPLKRLVRSLRK